MARYCPRALRFFRSSELPAIREDDERVQRLREIASRMPDAVEEAFKLSEDPGHCGLVHMVAARYLREKGFDAEVVPALFTGRSPTTEEQHGKVVAARSSRYAKLMSMLPVYQRNPKRYSDEIGADGAQAEYYHAHLYLAEDCFVRVNLSGPGHPREHYMLHAAYGQFLPPGKRAEAPPVILDRVDALKLKRKYKLALTSPEHARVVRDIEAAVFADTPPQGAGEDVMQLRRHMQERYGIFKARMDEAVQ